ncbi:hypothetical protein FRC09_011740 [Ceratobasidium sp. 395]|nr:hypothetical protein FRC09_011740 [Ceratobasidium sp. 395]
MPETWKQPFQLGVKAFRESNYEDAIKHFTRSIELDSSNASVFDSRAAAYQSVSKLRQALADSRKCISLQPDRYVVTSGADIFLIESQGYYRSARIFLAMSKHDRCIHMLGEARRRMNPVDTSYARKAQEMDEMETTAREGLQAAETYRRNHVDPLKKLPLELLVEICRIAVDASDTEAGPRGASYFAIVLGSVCQSLRALVHRTPPLWQNVVFTEKRFARKSAFWLERLDGYPLYSVALCRISRQTIPQVVNTLATTSPESWKSLRVEGGTVNDAQALYMALQAFPLSLYSFSVVAPLESQSYSFPLGATLTCISPVLDPHSQGCQPRSISLHTGSITVNTAALPYITHLEFNMSHIVPAQYNLIHQLLYAAPRLRSLIISSRGLSIEAPCHPIPDVPELQGPGPFYVEQLEVLRIAAIGPTARCNFFFPKLQVLDLQHMSSASVSAVFDYLLQEYAPRTRPPIREIRLNQVAISAPTFKKLLETFSPTLESLEVSCCGGLDGDFMECLSRPIPGTDELVCCPRLCDINFNGTNDLKAGSLVRLIKARLPSVHANNPNPPTPIRNLMVDSCASIDSEALPWMRANVTGVLSCVYKSKAEAKGRKRDRYL